MPLKPGLYQHKSGFSSDECHECVIIAVDPVTSTRVRPVKNHPRTFLLTLSVALFHTGLSLPPTIYAAMVTRALSVPDHEVCGLLSGWDGRINGHYPLRNAATDTRLRYAADPAEFVAAYRAIVRTGELVAIYHSHPHGPAVPSATDLAEATWPDVAYLIVGLGGARPEARAWQIRDGRALEVPIVISGQG